MNIGKKLKTISALCGAALLTVSLAACGQQDAAGFIGLDAAKAIALENAGVAESAATFSATELDRQSGSGVYTIDFTANGQSYAYDIDALTGSILSGAPETAGASAGTAITAQQAQEIALSHAGLSSSQVSFVRAHLDWDDGRQVYEVEFYNTSNYTEYDYEIDASSGDILSYDHEAEYYQRPSTGTGSSGNSGGSAAISTEQAKQIALARVPGATDIRIQLDRDDGRLEYEGKIIYNNTEYEFTIDGYSGAIREWDAEPFHW